jgi:hypothetical protein
MGCEEMREEGKGEGNESSVFSAKAVVGYTETAENVVDRGSSTSAARRGRS